MREGLEASVQQFVGAARVLHQLLTWCRYLWSGSTLFVVRIQQAVAGALSWLFPLFALYVCFPDTLPACVHVSWPVVLRCLLCCAVQRIGPQHQAGSDSLLTSLTFIKLAKKFFAGVEGASKHMGVLYGLGVDGADLRAPE